MANKSTAKLVQDIEEMHGGANVPIRLAFDNILANDKQQLAQINELKTEKWKLKQEIAEKDKQIIELLKTSIGKAKMPRENLNLVLD